MLPRNAEVVWWLIDDFATQGGLLPLDLDLVSKSARGVAEVPRHALRQRQRQGQAAPPAPTLRVAGRSLTVPASGLVTVHLQARARAFHARATAPNSIRSDQVSGKA